MSVSSIDLPPDCTKELERLVDHLSDENLAELAATEAALQVGGFRKSKPAILRTRVRQIVCGGAEISASMRRMLARRSQAAAVLRLLPLDVITAHWAALIAVLGQSAFTVALLLDVRAEIRAKGEGWLSSPNLSSNETKRSHRMARMDTNHSCPFVPFDDKQNSCYSMTDEEALTHLREVFAPLTGLLGASATAEVPVTQNAWREQKEQLELRIRELSEQNRRLKGVDDRLSGVKRQLAASEEQVASAKRRADEAERALRQKNVAYEEVAAELAREISHREERLIAAVDLALAKEFHGWLADARAVEAESGNTGNSGKAETPPPSILNIPSIPHVATTDLLSRAEAALAHQQEIDRHSGNRAKLERRLDALASAHGRVKDALRTALRQSPDLKLIERELETEIERLRQTLGCAAAADPLERALIDRIHLAHDNELPELRTLPQRLAAAGVLRGDARARVRDAFQKRFSVIEALGVSPEAETEEKRNAVSMLGRALAGQIPAILLVDGHNALFGLPTRYNPPRGKALSETEKRDRLVSDIVWVMAPNPASRAWVVFDGATRSDTQAAPNVRVTYSGGVGEHRADGVLLDNIRFFKGADPEVTVLLVSNDSDLCKSAVRLGAQVVPVLDLGAFFEHEGIRR